MSIVLLTQIQIQIKQHATDLLGLLIDDLINSFSRFMFN